MGKSNNQASAVPPETSASAPENSTEAAQAEPQTSAAENTAAPKTESEVYIEILRPTSIGIKNYLQGAKVYVPASVAKELITKKSAKKAKEPTED